jgi:hypothetical protein
MRFFGLPRYMLRAHCWYSCRLCRGAAALLGRARRRLRHGPVRAGPIAAAAALCRHACGPGRGASITPLRAAFAFPTYRALPGPATWARRPHPSELRAGEPAITRPASSAVRHGPASRDGPLDAPPPPSTVAPPPALVVSLHPTHLPGRRGAPCSRQGVVSMGWHAAGVGLGLHTPRLQLLQHCSWQHLMCAGLPPQGARCWQCWRAGARAGRHGIV